MLDRHEIGSRDEEHATEKGNPFSIDARIAFPIVSVRLVGRPRPFPRSFRLSERAFRLPEHPLLLPFQQVSPFNDRAAPELTDWQTYKPPTRDYDETVFNVVPYADEHGDTLAVLHNSSGDLGVSVGFNIQQLPVFSLWKNTDTLGQGYVTGLEPGTSFAYNRSYRRALNRVPTIGAKEQRHFDITYTLLTGKAAVDKALQQIQSIQHERTTEVRKTPLVNLPKE